MQYTTRFLDARLRLPLFYQDFKDTFVCNTQRMCKWFDIHTSCFIRISKILLYAIHNMIKNKVYNGDVVLSGFQRYFCMQYTTPRLSKRIRKRCFIRISKILLYAIHNLSDLKKRAQEVVLSGFQRYFCMQYTTFECAR